MACSMNAFALQWRERIHVRATVENCVLGIYSYEVLLLVVLDVESHVLELVREPWPYGESLLQISYAQTVLTEGWMWVTRKVWRSKMGIRTCALLGAV